MAGEANVEVRPLRSPAECHAVAALYAAPALADGYRATAVTKDGWLILTR